MVKVFQRTVLTFLHVLHISATKACRVGIFKALTAILEAGSYSRHSRPESNTRSRERVVPHDQKVATLMLEYLTDESHDPKRQERRALTREEFPFSVVGLADDTL